MSYSKRWAQAWLGLGFVWFLAGIALAPSNKLFQQGMILFLWLPTLLLAWSARGLYAEGWRQQPLLWGSILLLLGWGALSLLWSTSPEGARDGKRLLYILVFLMAFPLLAQAGLARIRQLLLVAGMLLGLGALLSLVQFYAIMGHPWFERLYGIGEISHPILGAYVIAAALLWLLYSPPRQAASTLAWALVLAFLGLFVIATQSRGAALGLVLTVIAAPLWQRSRASCVLAVGALFASGLAFALVYELIVSRGASYRPEIFAAATELISQHPLTGLGLGAPYDLQAQGLRFDHSHNMFTHIAIELGLPGALLWCAVWLATLLHILRARHTAFGKMLLGLWLFATFAMQFDAASLTDTPRAEWFISWLPVAMALLLPWTTAENDGCGKISRST
ncbi:O-antigen ligase family protein [Pseudomonas cremoricolorata]|uniref:Polymerase n=1 Tax=Pseudomonas cremoricolorata TaxID=157783 RepID=A0A089WGA3_9PSED|nr:O-antigen ligase family protein [Pseudomonas cremoricolorata]AIR88340.1 polymerase [Pseudomonas cremoricolorata]